jgi:hypothetical protein
MNRNSNKNKRGSRKWKIYKLLGGKRQQKRKNEERKMMTIFIRKKVEIKALRIRIECLVAWQGLGLLLVQGIQIVVVVEQQLDPCIGWNTHRAFVVDGQRAFGPKK